ncbi:MAG: hypothetical protein CL958_00155 [Euryarchaeota archaeon]|nr:hypothetical protein [Marinobacter sp.]
MQAIFSHVALGFCLVLFSCVGESSAWGQAVEEVNYSGWGDMAALRCGGCCLPIYRRTVKLSFYPIASLENRKTLSHQGASRKPVPRQEAKKCQCINEAISFYGLIWLGLERKEVTPEQAKSQLTAHLECKSYCDRWEDCENLLRFIDQEVARQTRE